MLLLGNIKANKCTHKGHLACKMSFSNNYKKFAWGTFLYFMKCWGCCVCSLFVVTLDILQNTLYLEKRIQPRVCCMLLQLSSSVLVQTSQSWWTWIARRWCRLCRWDMRRWVVYRHLWTDTRVWNFSRQLCPANEIEIEKTRVVKILDNKPESGLLEYR